MSQDTSTGQQYGRIFHSKDKEVVVRLLNEQFGIKDLDFEVKIGGKGRIYAFRKCSYERIKGIKEHNIGIYIGKLERDGIRLSLEGCYLLKDKISKNLIEVDDDLALKWLRGEDIPTKVRGYVVLKWKNYLIGCGKGNGKVIKNFVPKDRRLR